MRLNVPLFAQRDPRWASKKLGNSTTSDIYNYGCAVACVAMMCAYYGKTTDVSKLNDDLKRKDGFDGPYIIWQNVNKVYSDITFTKWEDYPNDPAPTDRIRKQLNDGKPVIVWVDINPNQPGNQMHFIILTGIEGPDFYCNDPWYGDSILFSKRYGDPVLGILGHRFYSGPVPSPSTGNMELEECLRQHNQLVTELDQAKKQLQEKLQLLNENQVTIDGLETEIASWVKSEENWNNQLKQFASILGNNIPPDTAKIAGAIMELVSKEDQLRKLQAEVPKLQSEVQNVTGERDLEKQKASDCLLVNKSLSKSLGEATNDVSKLTKELEEAKQQYKPIFRLFGLIICEEVNKR